MLARARGLIRDNLTLALAGSGFRGMLGNCVFQSLIIFVCVSAVMMLDSLFGAIIVASLGASSFIIFITPHTNGSRARNIIGGYLCGSASGLLFHALYWMIPASGRGGQLLLILVCAAAAAVTTFLMISLNAVHPPSAALAIGICAGGESLKTAAAALSGVVIFCLVRRALKKKLKNLI